MSRPRALAVATFALLLLLPALASAAEPVVRTAFEVDLGDFVTKGELTSPRPGGAHGDGPFPLVLLIHGNGPHDMDATLPVPGQEQPTRLFAQIADGLATRGIAVARYHKRWVTGPGTFDPAFWMGQDTRVFLADAGKVLDAVSQLDPVRGAARFLYGWSEGTAVAAELALARPDGVQGLVLQGVVASPWRDLAGAWITDVAFPYADRSPADGSLTGEELTAALEGAAGAVARLGLAYLTDPSFQPGQPAPVSTLVDADGDGALALRKEVLPALPRILDFAFGPFGNLQVYAEGRTVRPVSDVAPSLSQDVLLLAGGRDASTPLGPTQELAPRFGRESATAGESPATLFVFPQLGHSLGPVDSLGEDHPRPMDADQVLPKVAKWLQARAKRAPAPAPGP